MLSVSREALDVMRKSLQANWPEIKSCLEANNAMDKWEEFKKDSFVVHSGVLVVAKIVKL